MDMDTAYPHVLIALPLRQQPECLLLVYAEFACRAAFTVEAEIGVKAYTDVGGYAVPLRDGLYAFDLCGTVGNDRRAAESRVDIPRALTRRGIIYIPRGKAVLLTHRHLAQGGRVHTDALVDYASEHCRMRVCLHRI